MPRERARDKAKARSMAAVEGIPYTEALRRIRRQQEPLHITRSVVQGEPDGQWKTYTVADQARPTRR